jgi:hypothetical protein
MIDKVMNGNYKWKSKPNRNTNAHLVNELGEPLCRGLERYGEWFCSNLPDHFKCSRCSALMRDFEKIVQNLSLRNFNFCVQQSVKKLEENEQKPNTIQLIFNDSKDALEVAESIISQIRKDFPNKSNITLLLAGEVIENKKV